MTKATVYYNGMVVWQPPAVYKSSCAIDVEFFPYDVQTCVLKLGSWTYDGFKVRGWWFCDGVWLVFSLYFFFRSGPGGWHPPHSSIEQEGVPTALGLLVVG